MNSITFLLFIGVQGFGTAMVRVPVTETITTTTVENSCKTEKSAGRRIVQRFLDSKDASYRDARDKHHVVSATAEKIKTLRGDSNSGTCDKLLAAVLEKMVDHQLHGFEPSFFQSGNLYYVALTRPETPDAPEIPGHNRIRTGFSPLYVVDSQFNVVTTLAM